MRVSAAVEVRYAETDQMGVVHHRHYLTWFELARTQWMRALGFSYTQLEQWGLLFPVIDVSVRYRRPARYEDQLEIEVGLVGLGWARMAFIYRVLRAGELLTEGTTRHATCDRDLRPVRLQRRFPDLYTRLYQSLEPSPGPRGASAAETHKLESGPV